MKQQGWIKLHRQLLDNPVVMKDSEHFAIWIYLLLNATHTDYPAIFKGEKIVLHPGQLLTGSISISNALKINESKVRRVLNSLKNDGQIDRQTSNKNSLISILNWDAYQNCDGQNEELLTDKCRTTDGQVTTNKNIKNVKNDKKHIYGEFRKVRLTDAEKEKLISEYGESFFLACVKKLDEYKEQTGKSYKNDNLAIRKWVVDSVKKEGGVINGCNTSKQRAEYKDEYL